MDAPLPSTGASAPLTSSIPEVAFVLELGRTMQALGVSVSTLEHALGRVSQHLVLEGAVFATPTGFLASLRQEGQHSKTYLVRVDAGWTSLEKMAEAEALVDLVLTDQLDVAAARRHLAALSVRPARYGFWLKVMQNQTLEGLQAGFQSLSVTVALMLGLLMANAMVARRTF